LCGAYARDVMAAILVFQNNETAAMLVYQTNPVGVELFSCVNTFFCLACVISAFGGIFSVGFRGAGRATDRREEGFLSVSSPIFSRPR